MAPKSKTTKHKTDKQKPTRLLASAARRPQACASAASTLDRRLNLAQVYRTRHPEAAQVPAPRGHRDQHGCAECSRRLSPCESPGGQSAWDGPGQVDAPGTPNLELTVASRPGCSCCERDGRLSAPGAPHLLGFSCHPGLGHHPSFPRRREPLPIEPCAHGSDREVAWAAYHQQR